MKSYSPAMNPSASVRRSAVSGGAKSETMFYNEYAVPLDEKNYIHIWDTVGLVEGDMNVAKSFIEAAVRGKLKKGAAFATVIRLALTSLRFCVLCIFVFLACFSPVSLHGFSMFLSASCSLRSVLMKEVSFFKLRNVNFKASKNQKIDLIVFVHDMARQNFPKNKGTAFDPSREDYGFDGKSFEFVKEIARSNGIPIIVVGTKVTNSHTFTTALVLLFSGIFLCAYLQKKPDIFEHELKANFYTNDQIGQFFKRFENMHGLGDFCSILENYHAENTDEVIKHDPVKEGNALHLVCQIVALLLQSH